MYVYVFLVCECGPSAKDVLLGPERPPRAHNTPLTYAFITQKLRNLHLCNKLCLFACKNVFFCPLKSLGSTRSCTIAVGLFSLIYLALNERYIIKRMLIWIRMSIRWMYMIVVHNYAQCVASRSAYIRSLMLNLLVVLASGELCSTIRFHVRNVRLGCAATTEVRVL